MNHIHILDLFGNPGLEPTRLRVLHIGRKLQEVWSCKLARDFPGRENVVRFPDDDFDHLSDYEITIFQGHHGEVGVFPVGRSAEARRCDEARPLRP